MADLGETEAKPVLTENELLALTKMKLERTQFMHHVLRQVAAVTYKYNCFEMSPALLQDFAQILRKSDADPDTMEKAVFFVNQWKGFCLREFDYSTLLVLNTEQVRREKLEEYSEEDLESLSEHELAHIAQVVMKSNQTHEVVLRYLPWAASVRTALYTACQFMRRVSIASGVRLFPEELTELTEFKKCISGPAFVTAFNIDECLFNRTASAKDAGAACRMPALAQVQPEFMNCIRDTGIMFEVPDDPYIEPGKPRKK